MQKEDKGNSKLNQVKRRFEKIEGKKITGFRLIAWNASIVARIRSSSPSSCLFGTGQSFGEFFSYLFFVILLLLMSLFLFLKKCEFYVFSYKRKHTVQRRIEAEKSFLCICVCVLAQLKDVAADLSFFLRGRHKIHSTLPSFFPLKLPLKTYNSVSVYFFFSPFLFSATPVHFQFLSLCGWLNLDGFSLECQRCFPSFYSIYLSPLIALLLLLAQFLVALRLEILVIPLWLYAVGFILLSRTLATAVRKRERMRF